MTDGIFTDPGTLGMSTSPLSAGPEAAAWSSMLPNRILVVVATVLFVINLLDFLRLWPSLISCIQKAYGNSDLEHSLSRAHMRNHTALIMALCFCLLADRIGLYRPEWWSIIPPMWSGCATIGIFAAFLLLRAVLAAICRPRGIGGEAFATIRHCPWNIFILMMCVVMPTGGLLLIFGAGSAVSSFIILAEIAVFYFISFVRTGQILGMHCNGLSIILYLCALEIAPVAALVASALIF